MIVALQLPLTQILGAQRRSRVLGAGSLLVGLGFGATALAATGSSFAATVALWTLGEILLASFIQPAVAALAPPEARGRYFGAFTASIGLATAAGPPLGGLLLTGGGEGWLWAICVFCGTAAGAMMLRLGGHIDAPREFEKQLAPSGHSST
jgi:MFS family permease